MDEQNELLKLRELLEQERKVIARIRQVQRVWWVAVFLLGAACGFALSEWIIDPVTIVFPESGGIRV
ncbi:MAG: hypothetical protein NWP69_02155 [Congregibacter sp.]|nr:hypothetical protein [Congregibacter sp.]